VKVKLKQKAGLLLALMLSMLILFLPMQVGAIELDLTPDFARENVIIDILSFNIVGPENGTIFTSVTIEYTGENWVTDVEYAIILVNDDIYGTLYGFPGTIFGDYPIAENENATVKLQFKISNTPTHGNQVDGKITSYTLTNPGAPGTDIPPINPPGYTTIDIVAPTVVITVSVPVINEASAGDNFDVVATFSEVMDTGVTPTITFDPDVVTSGTLTFVSDAWSVGDTVYTATYTIADVDEEVTGVDVSVGSGQDLAGNTQDPDPTTAENLFDVDTVVPSVIAITRT
jgi:hypothetical protein